MINLDLTILGNNKLFDRNLINYFLISNRRIISMKRISLLILAIFVLLASGSIKIEQLDFTSSCNQPFQASFHPSDPDMFLVVCDN
jgi:hypothetical protein